MKNKLYILLSSILASMCVGLGGVVFLSLKGTYPGAVGTIVGAVAFTVGLFTICTRGLHLFTGKVCYVFDNPPAYTLDVVIIWIGNLIGGMTMAGLVNLTRIAPLINETAAALVEVKLADSVPSLFILGILCNICIFIGVNGYATNPHEVGKYIALFLGVVVFILCGTEHCVADMFYFAASGVLYTNPLGTLGCLVPITLGNAVGGVLFPVLEKWMGQLKA